MAETFTAPITERVATLVAWLDSTNPRTPHEIAMRLLKLVEEAGEVSAAYIGTVGQNPRKGVTHTLDDVKDELCDVIATALVALASLGVDDVEAVIVAHLERLVARVATAGGA